MHDLDQREQTTFEVLDPGMRVQAGPSVRLRGQAAQDVTDLLSTAAEQALGVHRRGQALYRLAPSDDVARQLAEGSLRWATPTNGDASVLIKRADNGHFTTPGRLVHAKWTDVLGPVAWQAMAMATQQHYLVNIDRKLAAIHGAVSELLAQSLDDRLGTLDQAERHADRVLQATADHRPVSPNARTELALGTRDAERVLDQLLRTATREVRAFAAGRGQQDGVEQAWHSVLLALQVLARCSQAVASLPYESPDELQTALAEEGTRIAQAVDQVGDLATELMRADLDVRGDWAAWERYRQRRNRAVQGAVLGGALGAVGGGALAVKGALHGASAGLHYATDDASPPAQERVRRVKKPPRQALPAGATEMVLDLVDPPKRAAELLVAVHADGDVTVQAIAAPADKLNSEPAA